MEADRIRRLQQQKEAEEANLKYLKKNQGKGTLGFTEIGTLFALVH
jgi:hypothetical protein